MNLKDLLIFEIVAKTGSISGAAEQLNYVQSNVTSRIKKLEEDLKTTLFHRHKRGVSLTPEGKKAIVYAQKISALAKEMKMMTANSDMPSGKLDIASVETVIKLPLILSKYNHLYTDVDLTLSTGVTADLKDDVLNYQLDGAFVTKSKTTYHPDLLEVDVFQEKLVLISDPLSKSLEDLTEKPILGFSDGCGYRAKLNEWLTDQQITPTKVMELGTLETTLGSVISGLGIAYVPYSAIKHYEDSGLICCHKLPEEYSAITTIFIYRKADYLTPALEKFIETIKQHRDDAISPFYRMEKRLDHTTE
ncbi:LysR family transcriptional regulator [Virgibacillus sp. W0430]|uniref:LysR family transcriptional regulator n=1 Tax=Virgibacillus sp. W0430 TaxID=3391580 RepID=UPI003F46F9AE